MQVMHNVLVSLAVDLKTLSDAAVMDSIVYKSVAEKAVAHLPTEPPPAYASRKGIRVFDIGKAHTLSEEHLIGLHHFAILECEGYAKVRLPACP